MIDYRDISLDFEPANQEEWVQAKLNFPWYAARFLSAEDKNTKQIVPLMFNQAQEMIWADFIQDWDILEWIFPPSDMSVLFKYLVVYLKSRQEGVSTFWDNFILWLCCNFPNVRALLAAHEKDAAAHLYDIIKTSYTHMPDDITLKNGEIVQVRPTALVFNSEKLMLDLSGDGKETSSITIESGEKKDKAARSFFYTIVHVSEGAQPVFDDGRFFTALLPACAKNAIIIDESTANGLGGHFYDTYFKGKRNAYGSSYGWRSLCIEWWKIDKNRKKLIPGQKIEPKNDWERKATKRYGLDPEQLNWARYIQENECTDDPGMSRFEAFDQEYCSDDVACFIASGSNYFSTELVAYGIHWTANHGIPILNYDLELDGDGNPIFVETIYGRWHFIALPDVHLFGAIDPKDVYILSADAAEGKERSDYSVIAVGLRNPWGPDWVVGYFKARVDEVQLGDEIMKAQSVFNDARLAPENNHPGRGMILYMRNKGCKNFYIQEARADGKYTGAPKREYGFSSSPAARSGALVGLHHNLKLWRESGGTDGLVIPFQEFWLEFRTFIRDDHGTHARKGSHDDLVAAAWILDHVLSLTTGSKSARTHLKPEQIEAQKPSLTIGHILPGYDKRMKTIKEPNGRHN